MAGGNFDNAKNTKNDEFYTQLTDVSKELMHYKNCFKDKTVFCNCDDPTWSAFWRYFHLNFEALGLKKLISTHYDKSEPTYKMIYEGGDDNNIEIGVVTPLEGNGDFRNAECIELLKEADIVVTNPPFSLFREYVNQLIEYNKPFIIIGNTNALTYKEIFKLFQSDSIRTGYTNFNVGMFFVVPDWFEKYARIDEDGHKIARVSTSCWFTSLPVKRHKDKLPLWKKYTPEEYPTYENYDAINVDKYTDIPCDYNGVIGVPITFLDKYNPDQFEIVSLGIVGTCDFTNNREMIILDKNGNETNKRTFNAKGTLYRKHLSTDKKPAAFKDVKTGELYQSIYARVLIRKKVGA